MGGDASEAAAEPSAAEYQVPSFLAAAVAPAAPAAPAEDPAVGGGLDEALLAKLLGGGL